MKTHTLKVWPDHFEYLLDGSKTAEVRKEDRGYQIGDTLRLKEWLPESKQYTGRRVERTISHILADFHGLADGYVLLSFPALSANGEGGKADNNEMKVR